MRTPGRAGRAGCARAAAEGLPLWTPPVVVPTLAEAIKGLEGAMWGNGSGAMGKVSAEPACPWELHVDAPEGSK